MGTARSRYSEFRCVLLENKVKYFGAVLLIFLSTCTITMMTQFADNCGRLVDEIEVDYIQEDAIFTTESPIQDIEALEGATSKLIEEGLTASYRLTLPQNAGITSSYLPCGSGADIGDARCSCPCRHHRDVKVSSPVDSTCAG